MFPADIGEVAFVGLPRVLDRVLRKANVADASLHTLRHTPASVVAELGFSDLTIADLSGHASRGMTQRYVMMKRWLWSQTRHLAELKDCW